MAIVFISPRQRQKIFFLGITAVFLIILIFVLLSVLFISPKEVQPNFSFNKPKVSINVTALSSSEIENLEPFPEIEIEFFYQALTIENKKAEGYIWAVSEEKARDTLEELKLSIIKIEEIGVGRDNPFEPY